MATAGDDLAGVIVKVPAASGLAGVIVKVPPSASGQQPTPPLCGANDCGQPVQLPSNSYCLQCAQWFCSGCLKDHNKFLKGHTLTDKPAAGGYRKCQTHPHIEEKYYCKQCKEAICSECLVKTCKRHKTCAIEQQVGVVETELQERATTMTAAITAEKDYQQQLEAELTDVRTDQQTTNSQIDQYQQAVSSRRLQKFIQAKTRNREMVKEFDDTIQKLKQTSDLKIQELQAGLDSLKSLEDSLATLTKTDRLGLLQDLPVVGDVRRQHVAAPTLLRDVEHVKHVGCQATAACSDHGTVRFRRPVAEIRPDNWYYSDESRVGHVPWSLAVRRYPDGRLDVVLFSDRHGTLSADYELDVEFSVRVLHPTKRKKHVSRGNRTHTFTPGRNADGWSLSWSGPFCRWRTLETQEPESVKVKRRSRAPQPNSPYTGSLMTELDDLLSELCNSKQQFDEASEAPCNGGDHAPQSGAPEAVSSPTPVERRNKPDDLERGGHIADGFLTVEIDVHVKSSRNVPRPCEYCGR